MTSRHECKYWKNNLPRATRWCSYCGRRQYRINGVWEDDWTIGRFVNHWTPLNVPADGPVLSIEGGQIFEFNCYESWGTALWATVCGVRIGPSRSLVHLHHELEKVFGAHESWEIFDGKKAED